MAFLVRRYDPDQLRNPDGTWAGGVFDMAGFNNVVEIEGTFGDLAMGIDDVGDVRLAFRDHGQVVELDLGADDVEQLRGSLNELASARDELPEDADPQGVYEDARFGFDDGHTVELYGSGVIAVTFGADEDDPVTLLLDPPDDGDEESDPTDDVADLIDAIDEVLQGVSVDEVERKFNPSQLRVGDGVDGGQWTSTGATRDTLRLAGRIDLAPGERLVGSGRVDSSQGGLRMAVTETAGRRMVRLGLGPEGYGQRDRDEGIAAWDGNPSAPPLTPTEREILAAESDSLEDQYDGASPDRQEEIETRLDEIRERLTTDRIGFNGTAELDEYSMRRLADRIRPALAEAEEQLNRENAAYAELEELELDPDADPARLAELRQRARVDPDSPGYHGITFDEGVVPGSRWGDVHFGVDLSDSTSGVEIRLGVTPKGAPDDWGDAIDWQGYFNVADMRKFLRLTDRAFADAERSRSPENGDAPAGGQFAPGGGRVGGKSKGKRPAPRRRGPARPTAPAGHFSFDGKTGTGYGVKGGDAGVRGLQAQLTRLGVTDSDGQKLAADGRYGPRTTSAVKTLQTALGLQADGKVTPELLKQVGELKQLPSTPQQSKPATRRRPKPAAGQTATRRSRPTSAKEALRAVLTGLLQQRRGE